MSILNNFIDFVEMLCLFIIPFGFSPAKAKVQRTKAFLRVLKYSTGGVLEVMFHSIDYITHRFLNCICILALMMLLLLSRFWWDKEHGTCVFLYAQ